MIPVRGLTMAVLSALSACGSSSLPELTPAPQHCAVTPSPGTRQLRQDGRWLVDPQGRVVLTHGVNLIWKIAPFVPPDSAEGFITADADWLADHGFNSARIGTLWVGVSPDAPGAIDTSYLEAWDRVVQLLAARRIWMLFDFHQDLLAAIYQGEGVPEWALLPGQTTTLLGSPALGFPFNYFTPQVSEAFDNLWAERGTVWDGHRDAWKAVASRWKTQPYSMGYDLLNEPWSGLEWPTCLALPGIGCPSTERNELQPFFENAIAGIRSVDPDNLVWMEPQLLAGGTGNPTGFAAIPGESQLGLSYHNYCPLTSFLQALQLGLFDAIPGFQLGQLCESFEQNVVTQAQVTARRIDGVELMTEFGATDDLALLKRVTRIADEHLSGWQYWSYKEWNDPTTQSQTSGAQGLFTDDADLTTAKQDKLRVLQRPYPQATAGTPLSLSFDPDSGEFRYRYTPHCAAGPTEIYVPTALHYPQGYRLTVTGANVLSEANSSLLRLENQPGATEVSISLSRE